MIAKTMILMIIVPDIEADLENAVEDALAVDQDQGAAPGLILPQNLI